MLCGMPNTLMAGHDPANNPLGVGLGAVRKGKLHYRVTLIKILLLGMSLQRKMLKQKPRYVKYIQL